MTLLLLALLLALVGCAPEEDKREADRRECFERWGRQYSEYDPAGRARNRDYFEACMRGRGH